MPFFSASTASYTNWARQYREYIPRRNGWPGDPPRGKLIKFGGLDCLFIIGADTVAWISPLGVPKPFPVPWKFFDGKWAPRRPVHA